MDFSLNEEQRGWQLKAREFAQEEISKISLQRDAIAGARDTFDWEIIKKGSKLGFRTLALHKEWGGHGADMVTQVLVMAELARADSAISKTFSQNWKWSHLIAAACTDEQKKRFLPKFVAERHLPVRCRQHRAERRLRQPHAAGGRAEIGHAAARRAQGRRVDPQRREMLHRQRQRRQAVLHPCAHQPGGQPPGGRDRFPGDHRHAGLPHRQGLQQTRLALLPECRAHLRERARAARQSCRRSQRRRQGARRRHFALQRIRARRQRAGRLRRRLRARARIRAHPQARRPLAGRPAARAARHHRDACDDRGAAVLRAAHRLGARSGHGRRQVAARFSERLAVAGRRATGDPAGQRARHGHSRLRPRRDERRHRQARARRPDLDPSRRRLACSG